jgi:hypothetical protein
MELKMSKKASANMWWIIIGAVIALVVMIILMVMFTGKTSKLEGGLSACEGKGGICAKGTICPANTLKATAFDCTQGSVCCLGAPKLCQKECPDKTCIESESGTDYCPQ